MKNQRNFIPPYISDGKIAGSRINSISVIFEGVQFNSSESSHTQTERADHSSDQDDH